MSEQGDEFMPTPERDRRARSFAGVAQEYDRGRPGYPQEAISWLLGDGRLEVADVGAGTGKLSAAALAGGHRVIAVEPLQPMRAVLRDVLPDVRALAGSAERLPLADASVDAVLVGAAFHWFEQEAALAEIARVLRPPGLLGLLGNSFDTSLAWVARLREILGPPALQRPGHWPSPERLGELFSEVDEREFPHSQRVGRAQLRDLASSRSSFAVLDARSREHALRAIDRLCDAEPELAAGDAAQLPWRTRARRCRGLLHSS